MRLDIPIKPADCNSESAGLEFINGNGGGLGLRIRYKPAGDRVEKRAWACGSGDAHTPAETALGTKSAATCQTKLLS
jgi:hypothetical protein